MEMRVRPEKLGSAASGGNEGAHFGGIFTTGVGFHAARDVQSVRPDYPDSVGDIFWGEPASEDNGMLPGGLEGELPIEARAGAAWDAGDVAVEQPSFLLVSDGCKERGFVSDPECLDGFDAELSAEFWGFIPVKLEGV